MNGDSNPRLKHLGLDRPRPKRNHHPTKPNLSLQNKHDSGGLSNFFPSVEETTDGPDGENNRKSSESTHCDIPPSPVEKSKTKAKQSSKEKPENKRGKRRFTIRDKVKEICNSYKDKSSPKKTSGIGGKTKVVKSARKQSTEYPEPVKTESGVIRKNRDVTLGKATFVSYPSDTDGLGRTSEYLPVTEEESSVRSPTKRMDKKLNVVHDKCRKVKNLAKDLQKRVYISSTTDVSKDEIVLTGNAAHALTEDTCSLGSETTSFLSSDNDGKTCLDTDGISFISEREDESCDDVLRDSSSFFMSDEDRSIDSSSLMVYEASEQSDCSNVVSDNKGGHDIIADTSLEEGFPVALRIRNARSEENVLVPGILGERRRATEFGRQDIDFGDALVLRKETSVGDIRGRGFSTAFGEETACSSYKKDSVDDDLLSGSSSEDEHHNPGSRILKASSNCDQSAVKDRFNTLRPSLQEDNSIVTLRGITGTTLNSKEDSHKIMTEFQRRDEDLEQMGELETSSSSSGEITLREPEKTKRKSLVDLQQKVNRVSVEIIRKKKVSMRRRKVVTKKARRTPPPKPPRLKRSQMQQPVKGSDVSKGVPLNTHLSERQPQRFFCKETERDLSTASSKGPEMHGGSSLSTEHSSLDEDLEVGGWAEGSQPPQPETRRRRCLSESKQKVPFVLLNDICEEDTVMANDGTTQVVVRGNDDAVSTQVTLRQKHSPVANQQVPSSISDLAMFDTEESSIQPKKPPRSSFMVIQETDLQNQQDPCPEHAEPLHLYCVKCRLVVCPRCKTNRHNDVSHRVLSTHDAHSMLRTESVTLLRHYTLLRSMFMALRNVYDKYSNCNPHMKQVTDEIYSNLHLDDDLYLTEVVKEAEMLIEKGKNLREIRQRITEWESRQHDWGHVVYLSIRCRILANINAESDTVYIRLKEWLFPTPWIHLSHLLQPYLDNTTNTAFVGGGSPSSTKEKNSGLLSTYDNVKTDARDESRIKGCNNGEGKNKNKTNNGRNIREVGAATGPGGVTFPRNSRNVLLQSLLPYIIFNPCIRYFMRVNNHINTDITLVVEPSEEHVRQYLSRQRYTATYSPSTIRREGFTPTDDSLTLVEKQMMMGGRHKSKLVASYMNPGSTGSSPSAPILVKVSFPDILVVSGGLGLAVGQIKKGDIIVDSHPNRSSTLAVVTKDLELSAWRFGHIVQGLESFKGSIENEEKRKADGMGLRAKIKASIKGEEDASYEVTFGLDI